MTNQTKHVPLIFEKNYDSNAIWKFNIDLTNCYSNLELKSYNVF